MFNKIKKNKKFWLCFSFFFLLIIFFIFIFSKTVFYKLDENGQLIDKQLIKKNIIKKIPQLNKEDYDKRLNLLAHIISTSSIDNTSLTATITIATSTSIKSLWPVKTAYPNVGAILPFKRIIAYYGNLLSTKMGVLGEYPEDEMLAKLDAEVQKWTLVDPETPAIPALHYIVVTAQRKPGEDGKYRLRMPDIEIDKVIKMAEKINALVFLDIQIGQSTIQEELPLLEKYLKMPQVHLAIDPEFSMNNGKIPGEYVGTYDAEEINYVTDYLAKIVQENNLIPKIFIIHRYTQNMVTNYKLIKTVPEVQIVMNMDGWGPKYGKLATQRDYIYKEPIQFTGFKLFYKNDIWKPSKAMMTVEEILEVNPIPIYIQYQ
ncbi:MAG: hypothetical protein ABH971_01340 [bacterium]